MINVLLVLYHPHEPAASYKLVLLGIHAHSVADVLCICC